MFVPIVPPLPVVPGSSEIGTIYVVPNKIGTKLELHFVVPIFIENVPIVFISDPFRPMASPIHSI